MRGIGVPLAVHSIFLPSVDSSIRKYSAKDLSSIFGGSGAGRTGIEVR